MLFTYIVLSIGMYSLQRQKPQVVEVSPVVNVESVKNKPKKSEPIITDSEETELEDDILEISNEDNSEIGDIEYYDSELYEEITFQDDFDKQYREDVGDSYFEDTEETIVSDIPEVTENSENILE